MEIFTSWVYVMRMKGEKKNRKNKKQKKKTTETMKTAAASQYQK